MFGGGRRGRGEQVGRSAVDEQEAEQEGDLAHHDGPPWEGGLAEGPPSPPPSRSSQGAVAPAAFI